MTVTTRPSARGQDAEIDLLGTVLFYLLIAIFAIVIAVPAAIATVG